MTFNIRHFNSSNAAMNPTTETYWSGTICSSDVTLDPVSDDLETSVPIRTTLLLMSSALALVGNSLIVLAFITNKKLLTKNFNLLIFNLTLTDFVIACYLPFMAMYSQLGYWPLGTTACSLMIFFDWGMTFVSIFTMVAISVDRYWAACWSRSYKIHNTRKRTLLLIAWIWMYMLITWTPVFIKNRMETVNNRIACEFQMTRSFFPFTFYIIVVGYHLPSCIMIFCYVKVCMAVVRARRSVRPVAKPNHLQGLPVAPATEPLQTEVILTTSSVSTVSGKQTTVGRSVGETQGVRMEGGREHDDGCRRQTRIFRNISLIIVVYLILWTPGHVVGDFYIFLKPFYELNIANWYVSILCYMNSAINPLLYALSSDSIRLALLRLLGRKP